MSRSTKRSNRHSVMIPGFLDKDTGSSSKNQYRSAVMVSASLVVTRQNRVNHLRKGVRILSFYDVL